MTTKPKQLSQRKLTFTLQRMYPAPIMIAPSVPMNVSVSDTTHFGCLSASQTRAFFSTVQDGGLYSFRFLVCHINYVLDVFDVNPGSLVEVMLEFAPEILDIVVLLKLTGAFDVLDAVLVHPAADLGDDHGVDTFVLVFI